MSTDNMREALDKPEKCWSLDDEEFHYTDIGEAIDSAEREGQGHIYEGEAIKRPASFYVPSVDEILERMGEAGWDDAGEFAEDFGTDVTDDAKLELEQLLKAWADKHVDVHFYTVANTRKVMLSELEKDAAPETSHD